MVRRVEERLHLFTKQKDAGGNGNVGPLISQVRRDFQELKKDGRGKVPLKSATDNVYRSVYVLRGEIASDGESFVKYE